MPHTPQIFNPEKIHILESEKRRLYLDPEKILSFLDLQPNNIVADLGCGSGVFTIPISKKVKKIYGIDIEPKMIQVLNQKILQKNIKNISTLLSNGIKIPLETSSLNLLITVNTLHEFNDRNKVFKEIFRVLKPTGKLAVVDFKKKREDFGPPSKIRISSRQAKKIFEQNCFRILITKYLKYDYFLLFEKSN
jgi:ubiquinone/menaquinone biosynthesis C-methylase UbiE